MTLDRRLRVLHIAAWYPNEREPHVAPFVKAHYDALHPFVRQRLVHVEVKADGGPFRVHWRFGSNDTSRALLHGYRGSTRVLEWLTFFVLLAVRLRLGTRAWDVVVVHVAWPLFRFPGLFKILFGRNVVIIEHWSAYSRNFYLDPDSRAHARMRRMFSGNTSVVAVSNGLAHDILKFSQRDSLNVDVVANVVTDEFEYLDQKVLQTTILMASNWNRFRRPFLILSSMRAVWDRYPELRLVIVGGGPDLQAMREFVRREGREQQVEFLGFVDRARVAREMQRATIFAHPTVHETFSVVTAEANCCGVPVVVSDVGAIPELVTEGINGLLVRNDEGAWRCALLRALDPTMVWDRRSIAENARARYSSRVVGARLARTLAEACSYECDSTYLP